jgi:hypothetical protein
VSVADQAKIGDSKYRQRILAEEGNTPAKVKAMNVPSREGKKSSFKRDAEIMVQQKSCSGCFFLIEKALSAKIRKANISPIIRKISDFPNQ